MHKIILNSAPRTGLAWFQFILYQSSMCDRSINDSNVMLNDFIIRNHIPVMLMAKFENIKQCFVLRNPQDLIPSVVTKTMGGFGTNVAGGINMPHEYNNINVEMLINNQFDEFERYIYCLNKNMDNIYPFTFEQITEDINFVTKNIIGNPIDNSKISQLMLKAKDEIKMHNKGHEGFNNFLPTNNKPEIYYKITESVLDHKRMKYTLDLYKNTYFNIINAQKIKFDA